MIRAIAIRFRYRLGAVLLLSASAWAEPSPALDAAVRWLRAGIPHSVFAGPQAGLQFSRLNATSQYRDLVEPAGGSHPWMAPSWGGTVGARWPGGFCASFSPRKETYGLRTGEATVSFQGNPYPHTLVARTELEYNVYPVTAGFGWFGSRRHFQVQAGVFRAYRDDSRVDWTVDGKPYPVKPAFQIKRFFDGWLMTVEYGHSWGPGEFLLGVESGRPFESAFTGLTGGLRPEAAQVRLGYSWRVWRRTSGPY